jgi:hypothetical protein
MEKLIHKPAISENVDLEVPEFGRYSSAELRHPEARKQKNDMFNNEAYHQLTVSALDRALFLSYGIGETPYLQFPNGEHFQHIPFSIEHWEVYGNMESEHARINFMLENYSSRRFPEDFEPHITNLLQQDNILDKWNHMLPEIKRISKELYDEVITTMQKNRIYDSMGYINGKNGTYVSEPVFYNSIDNADSELTLYDKALQQIHSELSLGNTKNVSSFLSLYNRIKDPITPLRSTLYDQAKHFFALYTQAHEKISDTQIQIPKEKCLLSQLALESSFLAIPEAQNIASVVYGGHHELPYIYVDIMRLPRGELANPQRVVDVMRELVDESKQHDVAVSTPITVSYFQEPHQAEPTLFIVDGNNRATAILLMKYFHYSEYDIKDIFNNSSVRSFIELFDLDIEWERDLIMALRTIQPNVMHTILQDSEIIESFAAGKIPALLVQEQNFHTVAVSHSREDSITLLQPMHQAIYNQARYPMAIPSKQQSHGRAKGNDIRITIRSPHE